jgi:hypothetical protein
VRLALALVAAVSLAVSADAGAAKRKPAPKRAKVVCFKKKGKRVCRKRRPVVKKRAAAAPAPVAAPLTAPTVSAPAVAPAPAPTADPPSAPTPFEIVPPKPDCGTSPWVGYNAEDIGNGDFRLLGTRSCVPGPDVIFQLRNLDAVEHNLYAEGIAPASAPRVIVTNAEPGDTINANATLTAGQWRLFCSLPGHDQMSRTLTVLG